MESKKKKNCSEEPRGRQGRNKDADVENGFEDMRSGKSMLG